MSNINIKGIINNITPTINSYTPIIEVIVNSIWAIEQKKELQGEIVIEIIRSAQTELGNALPNIQSFKISDNGIGFNEQNRESFDTLYSDQNIKNGGKGFGRFICLKYFNDFHVDSIFQDKKLFKRRTFSMGKAKDIIINERVVEEETNSTKTTILLDGLIIKFHEKKLSTIANNILEKILPYFITKNYQCPQIVIREDNSSNEFILNKYKHNKDLFNIQEIETTKNEFVINSIKSQEQFMARIFKIYSPNTKQSKISLVAHKREVKEIHLKDYINEFEDEFYEKYTDGKQEIVRNYIIKVYVFGKYLDDNVDLERNNFKFHKDNDLLYGISQIDIAKEAAKLAKLAINSHITSRREKKIEKVNNYINQEAPWYKNISAKLDFSQISCNPTDEEINRVCSEYQFFEHKRIKNDVDNILKANDICDSDKVREIVNSATQADKSNLIHYVAHRRVILDLLEKNLEQNEDGSYPIESNLHDMIFPRNRDNSNINYENHNLWIIDERLNFSNYICSDQPISDKDLKRPDLLIYGRPIAFRSENIASNPITIFEFKRPQRDDFVNQSSKEDPVEQISHYISALKNGKYTNIKGRPINIENNTPCYGYIICDITPKIKEWMKIKGFKPTPDGLGWFNFNDPLSTYIELISWNKLLQDATMRNKIFFKKLEIENHSALSSSTKSKVGISMSLL
jgi:hypothetical protein